jgi:hypothetical protein
MLMRDMLKVLWYSPSMTTYLQNRDEFLSYWNWNFPYYTKYFRSTWLCQHPPEIWAQKILR